MVAKAQVPVFIQTNLGTRIAIAVSPDIIVADFKRELERAHNECFPDLGVLHCKRVMMKQQSKLYSVPDLLPLKLACWGCKKLWFINVVGSLSNELGKFQAPKSLPAENITTNCPTNECTVIKKKKKRKRRHKLSKFPQENTSERYEQERLIPPKGVGAKSKVDSPCESSSEALSISGIIDRYFRNLIELNHTSSPTISEVATSGGQNQLEELGDAQNTTTSIVVDCKKQHSVAKPKTVQKLLPSTTPEECNSVGQRKYERSEVGKRLVNSLQKCQSKLSSKKSNLSKGKKFWKHDACSIAKTLVFEIGDDD